MKIEIDTEAKTIKVIENVSVRDFVKQVKDILNWGNYKIIPYEQPYYTWKGESTINVDAGDTVTTPTEAL